MSAVGPLGILLLDTRFPRGPGDIGNAASYDFPVVLKTVSGATVDRVVKALSRPVFDVISFAHWVYSSMAKREFLGA